MKTWQEDQLHALRAVESEHALFEMIVPLARNLGFDYCCYGLRMPLPLTRPKIVIFDNYPISWQKTYQEKNYLAVDPTVQHGMRSLLPVIWSDNLFSSARELWEGARSFGLNVGCARASRDTNGASGLLTLSRSGESISESELLDKEPKMTWLSHIAHQGMSRFLAVKIIPEIGVRLTSREIELLRWTGDGKSSGEISDILNISERTVNFHIGNAMIKLNAANKAAAVIRAAMLGML
ncbi:regulatory protein SdiA [Ferrovum myxofaciens]|uniref:Regulatory protein SdiA n=1 Tax=Ferrovum myxofaciens TaxID=416213 RepID=A0A149VV44_9PROT|nr:autoinducer binding domain-containing protein [Ferrovum myxofaciens]KXW57095.1 regulatory protein SdiA [Ferrovum myxofaciens]